MYPLIARHPVVGLSDAPPQPLAKAQAVSERQLMCQRQAVKFSHVIHIRSEGGLWGGGGGWQEEGWKEGGGHHKGWSDACGSYKTCLNKCEPGPRHGAERAHLACLRRS